MAQFRAIIRGQRGEASRLGSKNSGIVAHVDGWNVGVTVRGMVDADGRDVFTIYATGGSNRAVSEKIVGRIVGGVYEPAQVNA